MFNKGMNNQIKCQNCGKWVHVTTLKMISPNNDIPLETGIIKPHKCEKVIGVSGTNCGYCGKHVNEERVFAFAANGDIIRDYTRLVNHPCVDEDTKCYIDMDRAESENDRASKAYFDSLNI